MIPCDDMPLLSDILDGLFDDHGAVIDTDYIGTEKECRVPATSRNEINRKKRRCAKTSKLPYSTDLQRRRKAELKELRIQVQRLSAQLEYISLSGSRHTHKETRQSNL
ncbi:hypothetical protein L917_06846 [Phytophthora nicotianae]|uniref:Uncharacterized protein n=1 Tax=Phytophthora nicotianae TaxID=4792 RepID=W2LD26_PHYNI|nr:hypothetical protein L917_06846 [Phytophthora nicotianae]